MCKNLNRLLKNIDSIICPEHPGCNKETGAVHSCGHNAQCAALIGIAAALKEPGILDKFCGKNKLCAVPAEELLEIEYRANLREKGIIRVHPIITKGGAMVNAIPGEVTLESYIRGESFEAMVRENKKLNRAFIGGAVSLGTNIDITDYAGYAPLKTARIALK